MSTPTHNDMRRAFYRAVRRVQFANYTPALLGKPDGIGGFDFDVPGGQGFVYVRVIQGESVTLAHAINKAGVAETGDLPVWLDRGAAGYWMIAEARVGG